MTTLAWILLAIIVVLLGVVAFLIYAVHQTASLFGDIGKEVLTALFRR